MAQQWYDELDNLVMTPETESTKEDDCIHTDLSPQDDRICINCTVNTSPGTSEVGLLNTDPCLQFIAGSASYVNVFPEACFKVNNDI